jgi:hypothetical protein
MGRRLRTKISEELHVKARRKAKKLGIKKCAYCGKYIKPEDIIHFGSAVFCSLYCKKAYKVKYNTSWKDREAAVEAFSITTAMNDFGYTWCAFCEDWFKDDHFYDTQRTCRKHRKEYNQKMVASLPDSYIRGDTRHLGPLTDTEREYVRARIRLKRLFKSSKNNKL